MSETPAALRVPRRRLIRTVLRLLGRLVTFFLARIRVVGLENIPSQRPLIVIANHIDDTDGFILSLYLPFLAETMVAADMPFPWIAQVLFDLYGFIPVMRGTASGDSTRLALSVLEQKGVVVLFPEGGIWRAANKPIHTGVAWLSQKSQAAVLPVGLMGTRKALPKMLAFKRPQIEVRVGQIIPPPYAADAPYNKAALQTAANGMMAAVEALIPQAERQQAVSFEGMELGFTTQVQDAQGQPLTPAATLTDQQAQALAKLYYDISNFETLKLKKVPMEVLLSPNQPQSASAVSEAVDHVFHYLQTEYSAFFTFRFGKEDGAAIESGLRVIQQQAQTSKAASITLRPMSRVREAALESL